MKILGMKDRDPDNIFRELDHTADLCVEIVGEDLPGLFLNAVRTLYRLLGIPQSSTCSGERPLDVVTIHGVDKGDALVRLLGELLYRWDTDREGFFPEKLVLQEGNDRYGVDVFFQGRRETFSKENTQGEYEIKAVTYHDIEIRPTSGGWIARVVLDV